MPFSKQMKKYLRFVRIISHIPLVSLLARKSPLYVVNIMGARFCVKLATEFERIRANMKKICRQKLSVL